MDAETGAAPAKIAAEMREFVGEFDEPGPCLSEYRIFVKAWAARVEALGLEPKEQCYHDRCECGNPSAKVDRVDICCDCGGWAP